MTRRSRITRRPKASAVVAALLWLSQPGPAHADWRKDIGTFRVGIVAEPGAGNTVPGLALLTDAYTKALGMKVAFFVARDYAALVEAQADARIEYAIYSATAYATASARCGCVEPLVAPTDADGAVGIRSVLVTRDEKLPSLAAIQAHRIALAPADSVAGSLLPLAVLGAGEAGFAEDAPFLIRAETALDAERMLVDGDADALFGWELSAPEGQPDLHGGTLARLAAAGVPADTLKVLWRSEPLRYGPHAVRSDLDAEPKRRLRVFLTNLRSMRPDVYELLEAMHAGGFQPVNAEAYAPAEAVVRMLSNRKP